MKTTRLLPLLIALGAAALVFGLRSGGLSLELRSRDGEVLCSLPVKAGGRFSILFTHSLAKSPVEEIFEVEGAGGFRLRETIYADFGAGLPHEEMPGQRMEFSDGRIRLTGYDLAFADLQVRVGHIADHRIKVEGVEKARLSDLARPGAEIHLSIAKRFW